MNLTLYRVTSVLVHVRSNGDRRQFVTRITAAYFDGDGNEYRKSFESLTATPVVPASGTHDTLNDARFQFEATL